ncbi:IS66 family insertion sequence element accessory protein TnpB [Caballeronia sp. EK]|uniref:IS66 family insertion sequence element accessory protein TnpB n=1 Tax=Caballeronia sp. EK TaxID=2767469 RepID=UPI001654F0BA|nr:IS66 family insertion sequence element accessory protein TnpB [Caballeronia sp. EK]MBC8642923.1 IS66 family insertion sequence element accessory protein TnpB [Caballeronia sp. EK]
MKAGFQGGCRGVRQKLNQHRCQRSSRCYRGKGCPFDRDSRRSAAGDQSISASWPVSETAQCALWLREWAAVIHVDEIWLAVGPLGMRAGFDTALARVVKMFGAAHPHHAYIFANHRADCLKVLVHDGIGIWLAALRLNEWQFVWPRSGPESKHHAFSHEQLAGLVLGGPWQRIGQNGVIRVI